MLNWFYDLVFGSLSYSMTTIASDAIEKLTNVVTDIFTMAPDILQLEIIQKVIHYSVMLALVILATKVAFEALTIYILRLSGSPGNPGELLKGTALSVAAITGVPWIVEKVYQLGIELAKALSISQGAFAPMNLLGMMGTSIFLILAAIGAIIILALILIQVAVRSIDVAVMAITGPILALSLTKSVDGSAFSLWWKNLLVLSLSQALQLFLLKFALVSMVNIPNWAIYNPFWQFALLIAALWVTYKAPSTLKEYAYSSGVGGAVGGGIQQAGSLILMRKMFTKGV